MGTKRWVHPEGSEAFPNDVADEHTLREMGFQPEGEEEEPAEEEKPKRGRPKKE